MKTLEWLRVLETQHRREGKKLFSVTELGNIAGVPHHALNVALHRLVRLGIVVRYAQGIYGLPGIVSPEELLPVMDDGAYITGFYALFRHGVITQAPVEMTCFTNRRHNRSRVRNTPLGGWVFVCVRKPVYAPPAGLAMAGPEQALCDFGFLCRRDGVSPRSLVTFRSLAGLNRTLVNKLAACYPGTVARDVMEILAPVFRTEH